MDNKIPTGSPVMDKLLDGGYEIDCVTTIYGPAGTGKTTACMLCAIDVAKAKKVIYVDSEGGFSIERFRQLCKGKDMKKLLDKMIFLKPLNFEEQKRIMEQLPEMINNKIGLLIIDTISMHYRIEFGKREDYQETNKALAEQVANLIRISRDKNVPVLVTNQVYASFEDKNKVNMVGGDILKYGSKCLIELQDIGHAKRKAILKKHRSLPENREVFFEIKEEGLVETKEDKKLRLF